MKCPCCNGKGGETDYVLYVGVGGGPYYECSYCKGDGRINIIKWLIWKFYLLKEKL